MTSQTGSKYRYDFGIQKLRKGNVHILHCIQNQDIELIDIQTNYLNSAMNKGINRLYRELILLEHGTILPEHDDHPHRCQFCSEHGRLPLLLVSFLSLGMFRQKPADHWRCYH